MITFEKHPTDPDKLVIKTQKYHIYKYTEEDLQAAVLSEREACAVECDKWAAVKPSSDFMHGSASGARQCAAAIRERMKND